MMDKKGGMNQLVGVGALALAFVGLIALLSYFGFLALGPGVPGGGGLTTTTLAGTPAGCPTCIGLASPPDLVPVTYDAENVGTALTDDMAYRKVGSMTWSESHAGTSLDDLEACATYEFLFGTNATCAAGCYDSGYGQHVTYTIPCQEESTQEWAVYNDEVEGSLTATFYNDENNAAAQAISQGQMKTVTLKWEAGNDEVFGNPYIASDATQTNNGNHEMRFPNMLCISQNATQLDEPDSVGIYKYVHDPSLEGTELKKIGCGTLPTATAGYTNYCYEAPVVYDSELRISVKVDADDAVNPVNDSIAYLYAGTFYIDSDTGIVEWGVENEDGAAVGASDPDSVNINLS